MATDLKKMVEVWIKEHQISAPIMLWNLSRNILSAMAAEIEANREEIEKLKVKVSKVHSHGPKV